MLEVVLSLLDHFRAHVRDAETNAWVVALAAQRDQWPGAHALFRRIRRRSLDAVERLRGRTTDVGDGHDAIRCTQYSFEELCLKSLYNETETKTPFDPSSPFSVAGAAVRLARAVNVPIPDVKDLLAARGNPDTARYRRVFPDVPAGTTPARAATSAEATHDFPDLQHFPPSHPGPYERTMGTKIAELLALFQGQIPDASFHAAILQLARTPERWSAGHAYFDILHHRLLVAMRARDRIRYFQHEWERACLQALYNATSPVHPFAASAPFWVAGAALTLARAVGTPDHDIVGILAPAQQSV